MVFSSLGRLLPASRRIAVAPLRTWQFRPNQQGITTNAAVTALKTLGAQQQQRQQQLRSFCSGTNTGDNNKSGSESGAGVIHHSDDPALKRLFTNNREWVDRVNKEDPTFFSKLGAGQSPLYLYIGCSDSRVSIGNLIGLEMGDVFVHRNIANMVVASDLNLLAVMTYAVEQLGVKHILLTGHYDCGGVRAAMKQTEIGPVLDAWVQNIRDVYRLYQDELDAIEDEEMRHRRLVEHNVAEQCLNIYKSSVVQKKRHQTHADPNAPFAYPRVHGLVFDPATGVLCKVPINYRRMVKELRTMYDLFDEQDFIKTTINKDFLIKKPSIKKK